MVVISKARRLMVPAYEVREYLPPSGAQLTPMIEPFLISEMMVEKLGVDPAALLFFRQPDNSMFQRARIGDIWLIDTNDQVLQNAWPFLIEHNTGSRMRRVFCNHDGSLLLSPEIMGPQFREELVPADVVQTLKVIGKAIRLESYTI